MTASERRHAEAKRIQERIAAQDARHAAQDGQDGRVRGRRVWTDGPDRTEAQKRREEIARRDAETRRDMLRDADQIYPDGRRVRDWEAI